MKSLKSISVFAFCLFLGLTNVKAQDTTPTTDPAPTTDVTTTTTVTAHTDRHDAAAVLTADQVALLKAQKDLIAANREAFKASLTEAQLAILESTDLSKKDIFAALASTFTAEQRALIAANKESVKALRAEFRSTLTAEQRQQLGPLNNAKPRDMEAIVELKGRAHKRN